MRDYKMSILFSIAIVLFSVVMFAVMLDAVVSVSRKPIWVLESRNVVPLTVIDGVDRREVQLPFVGVQRRQTAAVAPVLKKAA
jgi:hypothetical protein